MKELNEYTAEVMKRSASLKRERKARLKKAMGASCAAMLVCAFGVLTFTGVLPLMPVGSAPEAAAPDSYAVLPEVETLNSFVTASLVRLEEMSGQEDVDAADERAAVITDAEVIDELLGLIDGIERDENRDPGGDQVVTSYEERLIVTLTRADGSTVSYELTDRRLTNTDTSISYLLSSEQYAHFTKLFE